MTALTIPSNTDNIEALYGDLIDKAQQLIVSGNTKIDDGKDLVAEGNNLIADGNRDYLKAVVVLRELKGKCPKREWTKCLSKLGIDRRRWSEWTLMFDNWDRLEEHGLTCYSPGRALSKLKEVEERKALPAAADEVIEGELEDEDSDDWDDEFVQPLDKTNELEETSEIEPTADSFVQPLDKTSEGVAEPDSTISPASETPETEQAAPEPRSEGDNAGADSGDTLSPGVKHRITVSTFDIVKKFNIELGTSFAAADIGKADMPLAHQTALSKVLWMVFTDKVLDLGFGRAHELLQCIAKDVFARADQIVEREDYSNIIDAEIIEHAPLPSSSPDPKDQRIAELEQELALVKDTLQERNTRLEIQALSQAMAHPQLEKESPARDSEELKDKLRLAEERNAELHSNLESLTQQLEDIHQFMLMSVNEINRGIERFDKFSKDNIISWAKENGVGSSKLDSFLLFRELNDARADSLIYLMENLNSLYQSVHRFQSMYYPHQLVEARRRECPYARTPWTRVFWEMPEVFSQMIAAPAELGAYVQSVEDFAKTCLEYRNSLEEDYSKRERAAEEKYKKFKEAVEAIARYKNQDGTPSPPLWAVEVVRGEGFDVPNHLIWYPSNYNSKTSAKRKRSFQDEEECIHEMN